MTHCFESPCPPCNFPAISFLMGYSGEVSSSTLLGRCGTLGPICHGLSCLATLRDSQSPSFLDRPAAVCGNRLQILKQFLHFLWGRVLPGMSRWNLLGRCTEKVPSDPCLWVVCTFPPTPYSMVGAHTAGATGDTVAGFCKSGPSLSCMSPPCLDCVQS